MIYLLNQSFLFLFQLKFVKMFFYLLCVTKKQGKSVNIRGERRVFLGLPSFEEAHKLHYAQFNTKSRIKDRNYRLLREKLGVSLKIWNITVEKSMAARKIYINI